MGRGEQIARNLERYGILVTVTPKNGAPRTCRAMIQPLSVRRIGDSNEIGIVGNERENTGMLYIGPSSCRIDRFVRGTRITGQNVTYRVISARCVYAENEPVYVWAVLQETEQEG